MIFVFHCIICLWTSTKEIGEGSLLPNYTTTKKSWSSHSQLSENQTTRSNIKILKINQTFWQIIVVLKKSQHCQSFWFQTVPSANNFASSWFNISLCKLESPDTSKGSLCAAMPASERLTGFTSLSPNKMISLIVIWFLQWSALRWQKRQGTLMCF